MSREELIALLRAADPLAAAELVALPAEPVVRWARGDRDDAAPVPYGTLTPAAETADRLLALAGLPAGAAVMPVPDEGDATRPGSWGVQDLTAIAATRLALPHARVRPCWPRLGAAVCQAAVRFGADDWLVPAWERADPEALAAAAGARAVAR